MISERRILRLVVGGLALIGVAALLGWVVTNFERRTERIPVGYSTEARRNALLAAERFLARLEIPVESVAGRERLWDPPPPTDTLVVLGLGRMSDERQRRLRSWMERGGHLVVEAIEPWDEKSPPKGFLSDLGFRLMLERAKADSGHEGEVLARIETQAAGRPVEVAFQAAYWLAGRDGDRVLVTAADHPRILERRIGAGRLTVLSDSVFLTNPAIGAHDHAFFAAWLLAPDHGGKVWLLYDSDMPWLGALLWGIAPYALVSAGLLVLAWLWSLGGRLGPLLDVPERRRRDLIEHLDATGRFLWTHGRASLLVESSRRRVLRDWRRLDPEVARSDALSQAEALARRTGDSVESVHRALCVQAEDIPAFVEQAVLLQRLRQSARHGTVGTRPARAQKQPAHSAGRVGDA